MVPHTKERLLPTGTTELIINLKEDHTHTYDQRLNPCELEGMIFSGVYTDYFVIDTDVQQHVIGVHFKPGGAWPFLGVPAYELKNLHVNASDLWGRLAKEIREDLLSAPTIVEKLDVLERFLWEKLLQGGTNHPAINFALRELRKPDSRVGDITNSLGMSQRHFIELFNHQVGLTPKRYARIMRFQQTLQKICSSPLEPDWSQIALECGYFDQAHFIKDFRSFSGINPVTYHKKCKLNLNHVPLEED